ncbi:23S rRNA (uracil(1939)-C(5))-methyltransferase RlmD [Pseudoxanthomonas sacheonensis]|uniref:23S rRNA (uracil(1939)-C(5))-methyltransferase RlmD n=1 Tax=Pseudoxanthomonas sacheonensis TaxID=443615 RepID=A0ABU1RTY6_9GAMM|nr:23S rRNA (uracil(1939)-C(5))-methyltransferase RlmD [Pseudoxanthomonas sacheonensis]MDR6842227.1 23S rRNA (uracil1939-C5)-methyltransferase [Pseudoxanthomonas sacheonensis]
MARPRSPRIDKTPFEVQIVDHSHDGRGVARRDGKTMFVSGALPGERVMVEQTAKNRHFDEGRMVEVLQASPDRVAPRCEHFGTCSGCVLQHLAEDKQILLKQRVLLENLERIGHVTPQTVLPALTGDSWGYRRKGRFSVRRVNKKDKTLVGFRETDPRFVADLRICHTVIPQIGERIEALALLVESLDARNDIPQIEFIAGDIAPDGSGVALVFRHLNPLNEADREKLIAFAQQHDFAFYLQSGGIDTVVPLWPGAPKLTFALPQWEVELAFRPLDFIQVNATLNQKMIARTFELLDPQPQDRILDLFCGLGNFTLPMARLVGEVVGVEGEAGLVARARENAECNGLANAHFHAADLTEDQRGTPWMRQGFNKLLLDPPRSGADEVLKQLPLKNIDRIVYVSCHPASLARDAGFLVKERGYKLKAAGVMDMFPHTGHVESIALFEMK